jgi:hypothetical protein
MKSESNTNSDEANDDERTPINAEDGLDTPNNETAFTSQLENGKALLFISNNCLMFR